MYDALMEEKTNTKKYQGNKLGTSMWVCGARGVAVDGGTVLQTGRSRFRLPMVPLEFFFGIILRVALWPWG
jgi:hypothetical protein